MTKKRPQQHPSTVWANVVLRQLGILKGRLACVEHARFPHPFSSPELTTQLGITSIAIDAFRNVFTEQERNSFSRSAAVTVGVLSASSAHGVVDLLCDYVESAVKDAIGLMTVRWPIRHDGMDDYRTVLSELWRELKGLEVQRLRAELECEYVRDADRSEPVPESPWEDRASLVLLSGLASKNSPKESWTFRKLASKIGHVRDQSSISRHIKDHPDGTLARLWKMVQQRTQQRTQERRRALPLGETDGEGNLEAWSKDAKGTKDWWCEE